METGKSGRRRQTDVKITSKTEAGTYTTLIECKRWKKEVDGDRVDVLACKMEDLDASKGVIITTKGYAPAAEKYAKYKNIDIFVVRQMKPIEWGHPGRVVRFFMQFFCGRVDNIVFPNVTLQSTLPYNPESLKMESSISKGAPLDDRFTLYSVKNGSQGPNVLSLVMDRCKKIIKSLSEQIQVLDSIKDKSKLLINSNVELDISDSEFREMRIPGGKLEIKTIKFEMKTLVRESLFQHDRAVNYEMALIIENYISGQKKIISKHKDSPQLELSEDIEALTTDKEKDDKKAADDIHIMRIFMDFPMNFKLDGSEKTIKTNNIKLKLG